MGWPAMALGLACCWAAAVLADIVCDGGPGWLNWLVLLTCWEGFKLTWIGPVSLVTLVRTGAAVAVIRAVYRVGNRWLRRRPSR
jgi:hypothetical protein